MLSFCELTVYNDFLVYFGPKIYFVKITTEIRIKSSLSTDRKVVILLHLTPKLAF